jgi:hypothetical protein
MIHGLELEPQSSSSVRGVIAVIAVRRAHGTRKTRPLAWYDRLECHFQHPPHPGVICGIRECVNPRALMAEPVFPLSDLCASSLCTCDTNSFGVYSPMNSIDP